MVHLTSYDMHLILSCISNKIQDINKYEGEDLKLLKDYKYLYFVLRKYLMTGGNLDV